MPLYEYECKACHHVFEALVTSSRSKPKCPKCGSDKLEKKFSTFRAAAGGSRDLSGVGGSCSTGSCPTGTCPYTG